MPAVGLVPGGFPTASITSTNNRPGMKRPMTDVRWSIRQGGLGWSVGVALLLACPALLLAQTPDSNQSAPTNAGKEQRVLINLELDAAKIDRFRQSGVLATVVEPELINRIDGVRIARPYFFSDEDFVADEHVEKIGDAIIIHIDPVALDRLDFQPLLSKVYYSNYSVIILKLTDFGQQTSPADVDQAPKFFARIDDRRGLNGRLNSTSNWKLTTDFGSIDVDVEQIAGVKFNLNSSNDDQVLLVLQSGKQWIGDISFDQITLDCSWGQQSINLSELQSITVDRNQRFCQDPDTRKWQLGPIPATTSDSRLGFVPGPTNPTIIQPQH